MTTTRVGIADITASDTTKRVRYTFGMLLGVDDLNQESAYHLARLQWAARDLIGYGTAWGLAVAASPEPAVVDPAHPELRARVTVDRGVGLTPLGELVCVPAMQCAYLAPWLRTHVDDVASIQPSDGTLPLYVVLCYRHRETDAVPIAGEPCRTEDELTAPSRVADDFELQLRTTLPAQCEDDAIRDFVAWLREVPIVAGPGALLADFEAEVRAAAIPPVDAGSPPGSPPASPPGPGSPPFVLERCEAMVHPPAPGIEIPADDVEAYLRAAFRIWTTEIRPQWRYDVGCGSECEPPPDAGCLLLAELAVPVHWDSGTPIPTTDPIDVHEADRPYLLSERMLQEWALSGVGEPFDAGSPPAGSPPSGATLPAVVAAGYVGADGDVGTAPHYAFNNLAVVQLSADPVNPVAGGYRLTFDGHHVEGHYVVTGTPVHEADQPRRAIEVLGATEVLASGQTAPGIYVRLFNTGNGGASDASFHVQVLELPGAP